MKIFLIGFKLCLDFRKIMLQIRGSISFCFLQMYTYASIQSLTSNQRLPTIPQEVQQRKLLYMGLHLLIWGEAANLRLMPECLCYIYHHMAFELYGMLAGNVSPITGENIKPVLAYGGEEEAFLRKVVTPIDEVIAREAARSGRGKAKHSQRRNYHDLNEYFWSVNCFRLGWPMHADADFFCLPVEELRAERNRINY